MTICNYVSENVWKMFIFEENYKEVNYCSRKLNMFINIYENKRLIKLLILE